MIERTQAPAYSETVDQQGAGGAGGAGARSLPLMALAMVSWLQGTALLAYALFDIVEAVTVGISGPAPVSNASGLMLQILLFLVFGVGLILVGRGWWQVRRWARAPFVLAQLIALVVGVPLAQASDASVRIPGLALSAIAGVGLILVFLPRTTRALLEH